MADRDSKGLFQPGNRGGPGRPKREKEAVYLAAMTEAVTIEDWIAIVNKAVEQAKEGNAYSRNWLASYLVGKPEENISLESNQPAAIVLRFNDVNDNSGHESG